MTSNPKYRVGVDVGGTFTDLVFAGSDGTVMTQKVPTTPDDYGRGIVLGIAAGLKAGRIPPADIEAVVHATTVATNTILEVRGARTALVTTKGFRDILEMRRLRIPEMYVLNYQKASPLVPRNLAFEVDERIDASGRVLKALSGDEVDVLCDKLIAAEVEAVAICLINAYVSGEHEGRIAQRLSERLPQRVFVTCSSDILPEIREYERASTTVINAYLGPVLGRYFESLSRHLRELGVNAPVHVMKSDGGTMSVEQASLKPAYIVESGPSAGVIGAAHAARACGLNSIITLDMGGTTAKAAMVEDGQVSRSGDYEVGAGINLSSKLVMGGGHALKIPVIDISEIGAGGGSLIAIDRSGGLAVGPRSAGASPGPVAYDRGGTEPTLTDAMILLGYINPEYLVGGELKLDKAKAERVFKERIADPMRRSILEAAYGAFQVAAGTMVRAVKAVSTYRGRDPREFDLFAFGGNGPVLATEIAATLEMERVVIPLNPGVFSAFGLLKSPTEHALTRAFVKKFAVTREGELDEHFARLQERLIELMKHEGCDPAQVKLRPMADLRYDGQAHELTVEMVRDSQGRLDLDATAWAFGDEHDKTYGRSGAPEDVQCVNLRLVGSVDAPPLTIDVAVTYANSRTPGARVRQAWFGPQHGLCDTPVVRRLDLREAARTGPLIVEEYDTTCIIPPGWKASVDAAGHIVLDRDSKAQ